ncbi:MAG: hypothetical protein QM726_23940 [Chitinophagaceae bacterium]
MCDYKLWCETEENLYVLQCISCNNFQVRFFNTALMLDHFQYQFFCKVVAEQYNGIATNKSFNGFLVPTFNDGVELRLDKTELIKLYQLLDMADTEMCAARLSGLF